MPEVVGGELKLPSPRVACLGERHKQRFGGGFFYFMDTKLNATKMSEHRISDSEKTTNEHTIAKKNDSNVVCLICAADKILQIMDASSDLPSDCRTLFLPEPKKDASVEVRIWGVARK